MTTAEKTQMINEPSIRLELAIEIEDIIERRYHASKSQDQEKITDLERQVLALQNELKVADRCTKAAVRDAELPLGRKIVEVEGVNESLRSKLKKYYQTAEVMKKENAEYKKLKPLDLKRKLVKSKQETKDSKAVVSGLIKERREYNVMRRHLIKMVAEQKREFEKLSANLDSANENFLYESGCKQYRLVGTQFESGSRPKVVDHVNYRIVNTETGASYVALIQDEELFFEEIEELPDDIVEFLSRSITFELAADE